MYWVRESRLSSRAINLENIKTIFIQTQGDYGAYVCFDKLDKWYFSKREEAFKVYEQLIQGTYPCVNDKGLKL